MLRKAIISVAAVFLVLACGPGKEEDKQGNVTFNLVSSVEGRASIFSNAGSDVREVTFANGSTAQVVFPATSTRLIGVLPALGISEGRASSVNLSIPSNQKQAAPDQDAREGGYLYCKAPSSDNPVRMEFAPMGHTVTVKVRGTSADKLRGVMLSSATPGLTGTAVLDLFKKETIPAINGGGKQVSVTLSEPVALGQEAALFLHMACVSCQDVQIRVVMSNCYYRVTLAHPAQDFSQPGETVVGVDLVEGVVTLDGIVDGGASVLKSDEGDFSSLLVLDDEDTQTDHIPDFSRVGYQYGDEPIPSPAVVATIDMASLKTALANKSAADTTDFFQQTIDRVGAAGGGAILVKNGTYNVSRILFLDSDKVVLRGESQDGTVIINNSAIQAPIIYMGRSVPKQPSETETESITFIAGRRVGISRLKAMGNGGSSSYGSVWIVTYSPRIPSSVYSSNSVINEDYVPVGRLYVEVRNPNLFKVGDAVRIYRKPTQAWLDDIGMTRIASNGREAAGSPTNQWDISGYTMSWSRRVTGVRGNRVYLDAPVVQSLEARYGRGELQKYTLNRVVGCGVENMSFDCKYDKTNIYNGNEVDESHAWQAVLVKAAEHCWVRNVTSRHMGYALADMGDGARCITVEKCTSLSPVSAIQGARRYAFCCSPGSELCLVKDCYCEYDRHSFVTNGTALGPNVFTNCRSEHGYNAIGPHFGWASGTLYDCILADSAFEAQDGGNQGTGHGWRGMNTVFWNVSTTKYVVCQSVWGTCPSCGQQWNRTEVCSQCGTQFVPSGRNYAVGIQGKKWAHSVYWDKDYYGNPTSDFFVNLYGWGTDEYNRPDGAWYPPLAFNAVGAGFIALPYETSVPWWPVLTCTSYSQPYSLYQCQLEDRHSRGVYLNTL